MSEPLWYQPLASVPRNCGPTVMVGASTAESLGLVDGDVVRLGAEARVAVACVRVSAGGGEKIDDGGVALDPFTRSVLRPFPYDPIEVAAVDLPVAERVTVAGAGDPTALDAAVAAAVMRADPVRAGGLLGGCGPTLQVVAVAPPEAVLGPGTEVVLGADGTGGPVHAHGHGHANQGGGQAARRHAGPGAPGFDDVGGLAGQIAAVRELVELPLLHPEVYDDLGIAPLRGLLFCGAPGTGKTLTARAVATELDASFFLVSGPEVVGSYSGQTEENLRKLFVDAQRSAPSVILVDEVDALAPARRNASTMSDSRSVGQLLALMDGLRHASGVVVIGTTNQVETIDPALRRPGRFDRELTFATPNGAARLDILRIQVRAMPLARSAVDALPGVSDAAHGFVGADLMELAREAGLSALRRRASAGGVAGFGAGRVVVEGDDLHAALGAVRPAALRQSLLSDAATTMADIGGYQAVKDRLVEIGRLAVAGSSGRTIGVLLDGPPGTGKTLIAQALADELGVNLIVVRGPEVYSQWLGESEESVRRLFAIARRSAPAVLVIDQLDALAPRRELAGGDPTRASQRVVGQLLAELDGGEPLRGILVVGVTSRADDVDPAVRRPGRIGLHVTLELPDAEDRRAILGVLLPGAGVGIGAWDAGWFHRLVGATAGLTGADLAMVCDLAALCAQRSGPDEAIGPADVEVGLSMLTAASAHIAVPTAGHDPAESSVAR